MQTKTRMNVYFEPDLLKRVEALALRRNVSKSAVIEAAVASFLSVDSADRREAAFGRRLDRLSRQIEALDRDQAILGETVSLFIRFWLTITPPLPESAQASARAKGLERFEGFVEALGRRLATGDQFIKELARDIGGVSVAESQENGEGRGGAF
ncbi:CopG family transcriptional regulator [Pinisolibacter aquiterrae]|uniref:ribbon-helix-helix domain-containing protein n=1 Tax=Pinisolibacter aquiterrae TaxID=2815579 RepID=UPI001C3E4D12|nr:CopG family transcriptional regulator [Pinisolibacter aquiterrae]MBV5262903.1 ribbon-helix-helix protein, CopG family [Pinisolibacter aquiterrae]MCC8235749.1 ribbon-helix-helix domain-containing protein [Pinisolibacter aquiterrae]